MARSSEIRQRFEASCLRELERVGPARFEAKVVVEAFRQQGVSRSTGFRWAQSLLLSGRAGAHLTATIRGADSGAVVDDVGGLVMRPPSANDIAGSGGVASLVGELR